MHVVVLRFQMKQRNGIQCSNAENHTGGKTLVHITALFCDCMWKFVHLTKCVSIHIYGLFNPVDH